MNSFLHSSLCGGWLCRQFVILSNDNDFTRNLFSGQWQSTDNRWFERTGKSSKSVWRTLPAGETSRHRTTATTTITEEHNGATSSNKIIKIIYIRSRIYIFLFFFSVGYYLLRLSIIITLLHYEVYALCAGVTCFTHTVPRTDVVEKKKYELNAIIALFGPFRLTVSVKCTPIELHPRFTPRPPRLLTVRVTSADPLFYLFIIGYVKSTIRRASKINYK